MPCETTYSAICRCQVPGKQALSVATATGWRKSTHQSSIVLHGEVSFSDTAWQILPVHCYKSWIISIRKSLTNCYSNGSDSRIVGGTHVDPSYSPGCVTIWTHPSLPFRRHLNQLVDTARIVCGAGSVTARTYRSIAAWSALSRKHVQSHVATASCRRSGYIESAEQSRTLLIGCIFCQ